MVNEYQKDNNTNKNNGFIEQTGGRMVMMMIYPIDLSDR